MITKHVKLYFYSYSIKKMSLKYLKDSLCFVSEKSAKKKKFLGNIRKSFKILNTCSFDITSQGQQSKWRTVFEALQKWSWKELTISNITYNIDSLRWSSFAHSQMSFRLLLYYPITERKKITQNISKYWQTFSSLIWRCQTRIKDYSSLSSFHSLMIF